MPTEKGGNMAHVITDATFEQETSQGLVLIVDENPNTARQFGIMSIPTLLFKKDGQVVKQVAGVHTKAQLKEIIAELS